VRASSAIRLRERFKTQGDVAAEGQGGDCKSGRIEVALPLGEVVETTDIWLVEVLEKLQARGVSAGNETLWRLFD
jgi:hypothetical protein